MAETLQERLIRELFIPHLFGDPHDEAARAEILALRARVIELEAQLSEKKAVSPARATRGGAKAD
jgi:hypothetical protein